MKVLQINSHYNQGGAARIVACIHRQLQQDGIESYVAYGRGHKVTEAGVYRFNHVPEIYWSALMSRLTGLNGWWNRMATKRLIKYIRQIKPDVIHLHALHGYYLNFGMLFRYLKEQDIPCVWTFHDCHAFVGNCGYFFDCNKWEKGCEKCPHLHNYPKSQFFDFTSYMWKKKKEYFTGINNLTVVTPTDWLTNEAKKSFLGKNDCITIRNGIDVENTFYPREKNECRKKHGFAETDKIVLGIAVGYSDPRKGAKYIIQAAKELKDAKVVLVGWEKQNDEMIRGVDNIVALPATANLDELAEYYSLADVFVLPSLAENYATVALESMACGTPMVGFDVGGIPEQVTDGKGIVVPTANGEAFTEAIRQVLSGNVVLKRGDELASIIKNNNSTAKMVEEYLQIYNEMAK